MKSSKLAAAIGLAAALLTAAGCRHAHLGGDTGAAYHAAFAAQRDSAPEATPTFDATNAQDTLAARRPRTPEPADTTSMALPAAAPSAASSSGRWPGATGNIHLEAK